MGAEKSKKAFVPFPFNRSDAISGFAHIRLALERKLKKQDRLLYANQFLNQDWHGLSVTLIPERQCHVCGFALIRLTAPNGWILETCSAHEIEKPIKNGSLVNFLNEIGTQHSYNRADERSKVLNLQQPPN
jgi:hypothetical protein